LNVLYDTLGYFLLINTEVKNLLRIVTILIGKTNKFIIFSLLTILILLWTLLWLVLGHVYHIPHDFGYKKKNSKINITVVYINIQ